MKSWLMKPKNEYLKNIVECYWYVKDNPEDVMILPPAISNDIIFNLKPPTTIFIDRNEKYFLAGNYFSGVRTKFFHLDQHGSFEIYGLRFKPWVMALFFNVPISKLVNAFLPIDENNKQLIIFNELQKRLGCELSEAATVEQFDNFLLSNYSFEGKQQIMLKSIFNASSLNSKLSVRQLALKANLSISSIERLFKRYIGITPNILFRILRYSEIWNALNDPEYSSWADIVYSCGYFDQAHFIKEFKTLTGKSPSSYMKDRNSTLDRYRLY